MTQVVGDSKEKKILYNNIRPYRLFISLFLLITEVGLYQIIIYVRLFT